MYSSLDAVARKQHMARFRGSRRGACPVLVVTDVAARGLDIPVLDNVINLNTPARAKLFVHRVGRVCRTRASSSSSSSSPGAAAGGTGVRAAKAKELQTSRGTAYTLVSTDELAHLLDLHLFLDRELLPVSSSTAAALPESSSASVATTSSPPNEQAGVHTIRQVSF